MTHLENSHLPPDTSEPVLDTTVGSRAVGLFYVAEFRGNPMAEMVAQVRRDLPGLREVIAM